MTVRHMSDDARPWVERGGVVLEFGLYVVAAGLAWFFQFMQDDAFISYRYSRNLARGEGLVFNPDEYVEGYTNFLWTVIHAVPEEFGWNTMRFSQVLSILIMVVTLAVTRRFARAVLRDDALAFIVTVLMVANMTFIGYGTGGLETMLVTLLVTSVGALLHPDVYLRDDAVRRRVFAGVLAGVAFLTRMDSLVLVATWFIAALVVEWRASAAEDRVRGGLRSALQLGLPALVVVVPWLVWKMDYYGNLLPNTFYAKSAGSPFYPMAWTLVYIAVFVISYGAFLLIGRLWRHGREIIARPGVGATFAVIPVWLVYMIYVGGDFMEFRFFVPIIPVLAMLAALLLDEYRSAIRQVALLGVLAVFSLFHQVTNNLPPVLDFNELSHWPTQSPTTWYGMSQILAEEFPGELGDEGRPRIAVAPLGVFGYFADLETVDMLGLTDEYVARNGEVFSVYLPGHVRMAPVDYLVERDVHLVIGQPDYDAVQPGRTDYRLSELVGLYPVADLNDLPADARVIEIPLIRDQVWRVIYLTEDPSVDAAIERNGWDVFPIDPTCDLADLGWVDELAAQATCDGIELDFWQRFLSR